MAKQARRRLQGAGENKGERLQLIARVQLAYGALKDTMVSYHDDSPRARAAVASARRRLQILNRALALVALEVEHQQVA